MSPGRIYGSVAGFALLAVFVFQPQSDMPDYICDVLSLWQTNCIVGVQVLYRWAIVYCLLAGYIISRLIDRRPASQKWAVPVIAAGATAILAMPLLVGFSLYYH